MKRSDAIALSAVVAAAIAVFADLVTMRGGMAFLLGCILGWASAYMVVFWSKSDNSK